MDDNNWYTSGFLNADVLEHVNTEEGFGEPTDPLSLTGIDDDDLVRIIDKRIRDTRRYYEQTYDLYERRKRNVTYLFGRQIAELEKEGKIKDYEAKNLNNVIYEIERTTKPLAMSQLPDLIITPGSNTDQSKKIASLMTEAVNSDLRQEQNRRVLSMGWKHRSAYFIGILKAVWDPQLMGGLGDYYFTYVHPDTVDFDHTVTEPDVNKMKWISQLVKMTVQEVTMRFPEAKTKFYEELIRGGLMTEQEMEPSWTAMATEIDVREVWFTDYQKSKEAEGEWERIEAVCWKYKDCILDKMKNPYWDYEGRDQIFAYDNPQLASSKRLLTQTEMETSMLTGLYPTYVNQETIYYNYFEMPQKPFFFMTYDQWGIQPLDETTHLEQNIRNQDTLDKRGKQIEETLNHRGHHIWSKLGGFKPADIQKMDHNNPDEDYLVDGIPQQVHEFVPAERPTAQEYQDLDRTKQSMYETASATAIRGQLQTDNATTNQIGREANYTVMDDMVEEMINAASTWMGRWSLQFIRWGYTQEHMRQLFGAEGETIFLSLHQNMVDQGMVVKVKASGSDKIRRQNNAQVNARLGMTEPLSYFEDMGYDDAEVRTARLITAKVDMPLYLAEFVEKSPAATTELAGKLAALTAVGGNTPGQFGGGGPAGPGGNGAPQQPSAQNTAAVAAQPQPGVAASPQQ